MTKTKAPQILAALFPMISNRYFRLDMRVGLVADQFEIVVFEVEQAGDMRVQVHFGQGIGGARKLFLRLLDMVVVKMRIAEGMDEFSRLEAGGLRDHHRQ